MAPLIILPEPASISYPGVSDFPSIYLNHLLIFSNRVVPPQSYFYAIPAWFIGLLTGQAGFALIAQAGALSTPVRPMQRQVTDFGWSLEVGVGVFWDTFSMCQTRRESEKSYNQLFFLNWLSDTFILVIKSYFIVYRLQSCVSFFPHRCSQLISSPKKPPFRPFKLSFIIQFNSGESVWFFSRHSGEKQIPLKWNPILFKCPPPLSRLLFRRSRLVTRLTLSLCQNEIFVGFGLWEPFLCSPIQDQFNDDKRIRIHVVWICYGHAFTFTVDFLHMRTVVKRVGEF